MREKVSRARRVDPEHGDAGKLDKGAESLVDTRRRARSVQAQAADRIDGHTGLVWAIR